MRGIGWVTLAVCILASSALAEEQDLFELSLEELGQIVVKGATLTDKNLREVPAAVSIFRRDDILKLPVSNLNDLMNLVPGFQSFRSSDVGTAKPASVRGHRIAVSDREILVLLNGMKIDHFQAGGYSGAIPNIPLQNIERVEFIRGPGSAIYGSNAFTGVVNIITNETDSNVAVSGGSFDQAYLHWQQQIRSEHVNGSLFLRARENNGDHYRVQDPASGDPVSTQDPEQDINGQIQLHLGQDTRMQLVLADNTSRDFYALGTVHNGTNEDIRRYAGLLLEQTLHWHPNIGSQLLGGYQYIRQIIDTHPYTPFPLGPISTSPTSTDPLHGIADTVSTETWMRWHNDWALSGDSSLQFGAEYRQPGIKHAVAANNYDLAQLAQQDFPITYYGNLQHDTRISETTTMDIVGLYAQYQYRWNDAVETIAGARFDNYSQIGSSFSPRLGLVIHPTENDSVKLLYGHAFRAPQANELYTINNPVILGNPDLKPETIDTWELIWLHEWDTTHVTLNYFYNHANDAILQSFTTAGTRVYINNARSDSSEGIEAELDTRLSHAFSLHITGTWLLTNPDYFFRESTTFYSASGIYNADRWYGSFSLNYQGEKEMQFEANQPRKSLDAFITTHLKAGYYLDNALQATLEILNLFDAEYAAPAFSTRVADGIPNRGREVRAGIIWHY